MSDKRRREAELRRLMDELNPLKCRGPKPAPQPLPKPAPGGAGTNGQARRSLLPGVYGGRRHCVHRPLFQIQVKRQNVWPEPA